MSYCKCSTGSSDKDYTKHSDYCPIYMRERIKELEAALPNLANGDLPWMVTDELSKNAGEMFSKYARQALENKG